MDRLDMSLENPCATFPQPDVCGDVEAWVGYDGKLCGDCAALVNVRNSGSTCEGFCFLQGRACVEGWDDETDEQCSLGATVRPCSHDYGGTSDAICKCGGSLPPPPPPPPEAPVVCGKSQFSGQLKGNINCPNPGRKSLTEQYAVRLQRIHPVARLRAC